VAAQQRKEFREKTTHTFPPRRSDGNAVSGLEELSLRDGVVHLRFEDSEKAILAYLLSGLWAPQNRFRVLAEGTALWGHGRQSLVATGSTSDSESRQRRVAKDRRAGGLPAPRRD
jgi:hypothetical protein